MYSNDPDQQLTVCLCVYVGEQERGRAEGPRGGEAAGGRAYEEGPTAEDAARHGEGSC